VRKKNNDLGKVLVADTLVHNDTKSAGSDVIDTTSLTIVDLVGHTLVLGGVDLDVNQVTHVVHLKVSAHWDHTMLAEWALEHVAGVRTVTIRVRHFSPWI